MSTRRSWSSASSHAVVMSTEASRSATSSNRSASSEGWAVQPESAGSMGAVWRLSSVRIAVCSSWSWRGDRVRVQQHGAGRERSGRARRSRCLGACTGGSLGLGRCTRRPRHARRARSALARRAGPGWYLEVVGGLMLSDVANLLVGAYCVKMRGGCYRFQAQYLRRIRVPPTRPGRRPSRRTLTDASCSCDVEAASAVALPLHGLTELPTAHPRDR